MFVRVRCSCHRSYRQLYAQETNTARIEFKRIKILQSFLYSSRQCDSACRRVANRDCRRRCRVLRMQGELVSRYLTAAAAIKRRLRSRGGLPMARLLPTTCHPGSRGGCAGYSASCRRRRRSVMLSRRRSRLLLRFHESRSRYETREKFRTLVCF